MRPPLCWVDASWNAPSFPGPACRVSIDLNWLVKGKICKKPMGVTSFLWVSGRLSLIYIYNKPIWRTALNVRSWVYKNPGSKDVGSRRLFDARSNVQA